MHPVGCIFYLKEILMKVLKFGGTSLGSPERIREVARIIASQNEKCIIVVSAYQGVTDGLKRISELAAARDEEFRTAYQNIVRKQDEFIERLIPESIQHRIKEKSRAVFDEISDVLNGIYLLRELSRHSLDHVLSAGERLSALLMSSIIEDSALIDSRLIIKTDSNFGSANVDFTVTDELIRKELELSPEVTVMPGFIASDHNGEITTLGRGGSDYSAAIIAAAIKADVLEIWTDVDGFMTADPRNVEKAYAIESLNYSEAIELSHFGAKVIYTPTLRPVYRKNIPIRVLNSFNPASKGTLISNITTDDHRSPIKGISSIDDIDLITLQGAGMVGVTGTSMRLFGALARRNINIILITQASSEYSISFAVIPADSENAVKSINEEFRSEIGFNELKITLERNLSIIAIVGEKMKNTPGISATLFKSLGRNGINVIATAQGSSELNISVVIKKDSLKKALNVIHDGFFLSRIREFNLFVAGTGYVGSSFLKQLMQQQSMLLRDQHLKISLIGITNSRKMLVDTKGISIEGFRDTLNSSGEKADLASFVNKIAELNLRNSVFIDCTAEEKVALTYSDLLSKYISVVTANKIACSSDYSYYQKLKQTAAEKGVRFMFETTVGAGLPIIRTINDLVLSGDNIHRIEAVLSGTMNFIFNELGPELPLSAAIKKAREKGFTEPDPRIDLSGTDVVRKILILAREAGYKMEKSEVLVDKFLPDDCFIGDLNHFYGKVAEHDELFEKRRQVLESENKKWRFFATLDNGSAKVGLITVDSTHPSFNLEGSNNIVLITTTRYNELPLVIKGYGAGAEVTAAGVFADLMRVMNV